MLETRSTDPFVLHVENYVSRVTIRNCGAKKNQSFRTIMQISTIPFLRLIAFCDDTRNLLAHIMHAAVTSSLLE
eukprot:SAG11_NODE_16525_length_545_cov_0.780269_1_plen_73_part_10